MRIAFISLMGGMPWGGSEELWYRTAIHAKHNGEDVKAFVYNWDSIPSKILNLRDNNIPVFFRDRFSSKMSIFKKLYGIILSRIFNYSKELSVLKRFDPDYVIVNQGSTFDLAIHHQLLYKYLRNKGKRYALICHSHNQYSDIPDSSIYPNAKEVFEYADKVHLISKKMHRLLERKLCTKITNGNITWNPLNITRYELVPYPDSETIQFASIGVMIGTKGQDTLLECMSSDIWKERNWKLNFYGDGPGMKYLKDLTAFYDLNEKVQFHGYTSNINQVWEKNHALLMPSASEGMPLSVIEAMVKGRIVIIPDIGGISEIIIDSQTGFIAESPSVESFLTAMERAWNNKDRWKEIGEKSHFSILNQIDKNPEEKLYKTIIS